MAQKRSPLPLHRLVFDSDSEGLSALLEDSAQLDLNEVDRHGNTALHLALMLGRRRCVHLLLSKGASVRAKNKQGWNALAEAVSFGDREMLRDVYRRLRDECDERLKHRRPVVLDALVSMGDFEMELKWDFCSWLPMVSRFLPSDVCRLRKRGPCVRMDTSLVDFVDAKWVRGDLTFVYNLEKNDFVLMDNENRAFKKVSNKKGQDDENNNENSGEEMEKEMEKELDLLMRSDTTSAHISTKPITFTRAQSGWLFNKTERTELINEKYEAQFYEVHNLSLVTRKRREHLSEEDLKRNKRMVENLSQGNLSSLEDESMEEPKASLEPPPPCKVTWEEYIRAPEGHHPCLGRPWVCKTSKKAFKPMLGMSEEFPLSLDFLLDLLEVIAPQFKHFGKLREFVSIKLPPGFPVQVSLPVLPTVTATVTFQNFEWRKGSDLAWSLFEVPDDYVEDHDRFPMDL